ncbi:DMT family transporter [Alphaproteobacteria bacterium]|jgi:drug/metabolite transporter (DMT)-like permease|nr:DMT family transporter [Alphaproteobacteria bacterium]
MVELWIPITILAAFSQNLRSALQKHLKSRLSTAGATYVRFFYAIPFALLYLVILNQVFELPLPEPNANFIGFGIIGGATQIIATALLVYLFSFRNFAVGTAYSKTETAQTAVFGLIILGDPLTPGAIIGIMISLVGVMAISTARQEGGLKNILQSLSQKTALIGLASGAMFGISAISYRAASLSLGGDGVLIQAAYTLGCVTIFQTLIMTLYLQVKEKGEVNNVLRNWRVAILVGLSGMIGSACWFTAMTLQNAAYVRALGQIELVFTFIVSYIIFREKTNASEFLGILTLVFGILVLLIGV